MRRPTTFLTSRHSTRDLQPEPVARAVVSRLLATACSAPSAHNAQPWRFVLVESSDRRAALADRLGRPFGEDLLAAG